MCNTAELFSFGPSPTRAKKAWSSYTCLLYGARYRDLHHNFNKNEMKKKQMNGDEKKRKKKGQLWNNSRMVSNELNPC